MPTLQELLAQRSQILDQVALLEKQIAAAQSGQRAEAVAKVRALMSETGLTMADISEGATPRTARAATEKVSKVAAKYRDPASGTTWSGRGRKPLWMVAALAAGKKPEDFAI
jgi:DNA-binding protein H-NS